MWSSYLAPGKHTLKVHDKGYWYTKTINVPHRIATSYLLPHRRFQIAPPEEKPQIGTIMTPLINFDSVKVIEESVNFDIRYWKV